MDRDTWGRHRDRDRSKNMGERCRHRYRDRSKLVFEAIEFQGKLKANYRHTKDKLSTN